MSKLWRQKLIAFSIHLLFSVLIIGSFMLLVTQFWFPDILFKLENVWEGLQILIPVDAILGPVLTLVLFVPGKKGLVGDLIIVALLQILALVYGGWAIYGQRPEIMVFAGDRFEIIPSSKFDRESFAKEYFKTEDITYPFIVYALPAQTPEEKNDFVLGNVNYQRMSERYRPLIDFKSNISKRALPMSNFVPGNSKSTQALKNFKMQFNEEDIYIFILEGTTDNANLLILDRVNLQLLGYLDMDPWTEFIPDKQD